MSVKKYKPHTPGRRFMTVSSFEEITRSFPEKSLLESLKSSGGRNNKGRVTSRHRGGGRKQMYRKIDWKRDKDGIPAVVSAIEYDPNRTARIALLQYKDGEKRYILAPDGLKVGDKVESGVQSDIKPGNFLPLNNIPTGVLIHNIEMRPGRGGQIVRSAGAAAVIMAKEGEFAHVRLPSGEVRLVPLLCRAAVGQVGNLDHINITIGKAGRSRWLGKRPHIRGVATNPVDHPHGGGEARSTPGRPSSTPWGKPTIGYKTRKKGPGDKFIVKRRK